MEPERHVRLFRNGRNQALRIPREFELPGDQAILRRDGARLILEPVKKQLGLSELLTKMKPIADKFPDIDAGLGALEEVKL